MSKRKSPTLIVGALVASSVVAISYKIYEYYNSKPQDIKVYTNKSIALTLSHSILKSQLPLDEILLNSDNVTFILPPNLSIDDLSSNIIDKKSQYELPISLVNNYKLLNCNNLQGYFNIIKNLKPDMLVLCNDDLGIKSPSDLGRFVREIITIDQNDIESKIRPIFIR